MPAPGPLANDADPDGDAIVMAVAIGGGPDHGVLSDFNGDGAFTYTPAPGFVGLDRFTYRPCDPFDCGNATLVEITVAAPNDPPTAVDDAFTTAADTPLTVDAPGLLANDADPDGDPIHLFEVDAPAHGQVTQSAADGSFTYVPDAGFQGTDAFTYRAADALPHPFGPGFSNDATVTITVGDPGANTPPVAVDDTYSVPQDTQLTVPAVTGLLANDTDPDGDPLTIVELRGSGPRRRHSRLDRRHHLRPRIGLRRNRSLRLHRR